MKSSRAIVLLSLSGLLMVAAIGYDTYKYRLLARELSVATETIGTLNHNIAVNVAHIAQLDASSTEMLGELVALRDQNAELSSKLGIAVTDNSSLAQQVAVTQDQISVLDKLRHTDKELLEKYSKVFFLNDNYEPAALATITPQFVFDKKKTLFFHAQAIGQLERLMNEASSTGHALSLISAYRSFKEQATLKNKYTVTYGKGANAFSADQGYSEHQLGTTVDFTTSALGNNFSVFDKSDAYWWLMQNGWRFGFIQSYPKNNAYYVYEPWHWRYVGVTLSVRLHQDGKSFYDLDQREIDQYLIDVFN